MSDRPAYIHHVNFPTTDPERTKEWYSKVFGMKWIPAKSNTRVVLMTRGNFDLHFTPVEEMDRMAPYHFAVEVEDWEGFLAHLGELGIRHTRPITRPENNSMFCYIHDPDHTMIEIVYHHRRQFPPPMGHDPAEKSVSAAPGANSADQAREALADAGQGIQAELLSHIFDRFRSGDSGHPRGTGLGLALVRAVARAHGGDVLVLSRPGHGSEFDLLLPAPSAPPLVSQGVASAGAEAADDTLARKP